MRYYMMNHVARHAFTLASLLLLGTSTPACYLRIDTRAGKRVYPSPENNALDEVPEGHAVSARRAPPSFPPLSVCLPEVEAPEPGGMDKSNWPLISLLRQRPVAIEGEAVHAALVEALRKHQIDARPLDHACRHGFVANGDTRYYLRPIVLYVEKQYRLQDAPRPPLDTPPSFREAGHLVLKGNWYRYQFTHAIALELSIYRQGGELVFQSRQAAAARLNDVIADDDLLAVSLDRLVVDLLAGRLTEVIR